MTVQIEFLWSWRHEPHFPQYSSPGSVLGSAERLRQQQGQASPAGLVHWDMTQRPWDLEWLANFMKFLTYCIAHIILNFLKWKNLKKSSCSVFTEEGKWLTGSNDFIFSSSLYKVMRDREGERKRIHYHFLFSFFFNKSVLFKKVVLFIYLVLAKGAPSFWDRACL